MLKSVLEKYRILKPCHRFYDALSLNLIWPWRWHFRGCPCSGVFTAHLCFELEHLLQWFLYFSWASWSSSGHTKKNFSPSLPRENLIHKAASANQWPFSSHLRSLTPPHLSSSPAYSTSPLRSLQHTSNISKIIYTVCPQIWSPSFPQCCT